MDAAAALVSTLSNGLPKPPPPGKPGRIASSKHRKKTQAGTIRPQRQLRYKCNISYNWNLSMQERFLNRLSYSFLLAVLLLSYSFLLALHLFSPSANAVEAPGFTYRIDPHPSGDRFNTGFTSRGADNNVHDPQGKNFASDQTR
jgi:hypothetical protein